VALARKLAVIMHRMLADGKPFNPTPSTKVGDKLVTAQFANTITRGFSAVSRDIITHVGTPFRGRVPRPHPSSADADETQRPRQHGLQGLVPGAANRSSSSR
jgi:hypothetical protein